MLNEEKVTAGAELAQAKGKVDEQNKKISLLDAKIKDAEAQNDEMEAKLSSLNDMYARAQSEVGSLTQSKLQLTNEVADLEKTTEQLRKGIINMREGQLYYRAGEVVFAGVMRGGLKHEENEVQMNWLLQSANEAALQRLGVQHDEKPLQAIWINKNLVDEAVAVLDKSSQNKFFRIRTVANIFVGELAVCDIEMVDNNFVYPEGTLIYSQHYSLAANETAYEGLIMDFLTQVNHSAVNAGVLPDPMTGKVGSMDAATVIEAANAMRRTSGKFTLNAYARGDISTAGPVRVRLEVQPDNE